MSATTSSNAAKADDEGAGATTPVHTFDAGWDTNGLSWSANVDYRFAVGSFLSDYTNNIAVVQRDSETDELIKIGQFEHYYPPTKLMYSPGPTQGVEGDQRELFVTSGDYLRVWHLTDGGPPQPTGPKATMIGTHDDQMIDKEMDASPSATAENKSQLAKDVAVSSKLHHTFKHASKGIHEDFCAPLTSFDWNADEPQTVATCSIDTTVTLWNIETQQVNIQLIAHDREVYDVAFAKGANIFASAGCDGSVRVFDLRKMENCTIVYEAPSVKPMLRVMWNKLDSSYLAAVSAESNEVVIIDVRYPSMPVGHLDGHTGAINSINWAPHCASNICSAGEDHRAVIWDVGELPKAEPKMFLTYNAAGEINNAAWSALHPDWLAITYRQNVQLLHV